jgi:hypothetical protein
MSQPVAEVGAYKNITATGAVTTGPCQLDWVLCQQHQLRHFGA